MIKGKAGVRYRRQRISRIEPAEMEEMTRVPAEDDGIIAYQNVRFTTMVVGVVLVLITAYVAVRARSVPAGLLAVALITLIYHVAFRHHRHVRDGESLTLAYWYHRCVHPRAGDPLGLSIPTEVNASERARPRPGAPGPVPGEGMGTCQALAGARHHADPFDDDAESIECCGGEDRTRTADSAHRRGTRLAFGSDREGDVPDGR